MASGRYLFGALPRLAAIRAGGGRSWLGIAEPETVRRHEAGRRAGAAPSNAGAGRGS